MKKIRTFFPLCDILLALKLESDMKFSIFSENCGDGCGKNCCFCNIWVDSILQCHRNRYMYVMCIQKVLQLLFEKHYKIVYNHITSWYQPQEMTKVKGNPSKEQQQEYQKLYTKIFKMCLCPVTCVSLAFSNYSCVAFFFSFGGRLLSLIFMWYLLLLALSWIHAYQWLVFKIFLDSYQVGEQSQLWYNVFICVFQNMASQVMGEVKILKSMKHVSFVLLYCPTESSGFMNILLSQTWNCGRCTGCIAWQDTM